MPGLLCRTPRARHNSPCCDRVRTLCAPLHQERTSVSNHSLFPHRVWKASICISSSGSILARVETATRNPCRTRQCSHLHDLPLATLVCDVRRLRLPLSLVSLVLVSLMPLAPEHDTMVGRQSTVRARSTKTRKKPRVRQYGHARLGLKHVFFHFATALALTLSSVTPNIQNPARLQSTLSFLPLDQFNQQHSKHLRIGVHF